MVKKLQLNLFIIISFFLMESLFAQQSSSLFTIVSEAEAEWAGKVQADLEFVQIEFSDQKISRIQNRQAEEFVITSPEGIEYSVSIQRVIDFGDGNWSVSGHINDNWKNSLTLSFSDDKALSSINITTDHNFYQLRYDETLDSHIMVKIDPHETDVISCGVDHDQILDHSNRNIDETRDKHQTPQPEQDSHTTIDVMIVYTPAARNWANQPGRGGIDNIINEAMNMAQMSTDAAQINLEFRLVHRALVEYSEYRSENDEQPSATDLRRLTASPSFNPFGSEYAGYLNEVHDMRDEYGADLVAMFTLADDVGGIAWLLRETQGWPEIGFSITRIQQAAFRPTHAHEMGHNMGNAHSRNQEQNAAGPDGGLFEYSTGWRLTLGDGSRFATVMTYPEGDNGLLIFSNPDVSFSGVPTGSYTGEFAPADNARSMREIKHVIANYRDERTDFGPPTVTTAQVTAIEFSTARSGGNVVNDGGRVVTDRGVCWSEQPDPDLSDTCTSNGTGRGSFFSYITGLEPDTQYHVRAFATNSEGTSFGNERTFTTLSVSAPTVVTADITSIGVSEAVGGGNITDEGGSKIVDRGVCWNQLGNPDENDECISTSGQTREFEITLTGLQHSTTYFIRAFATNEQVTAFGNEKSFITRTLQPPIAEQATNTDATSFMANWSSVAEADHYRLDVSTESDFSDMIPGYENRNMESALSHTVSGLSPGTTYYYRLRSEIETGTSQNSNTTNITTLDVSAMNSSVDLSRDRVLATGVQESEITITVLNSESKPVTGVEVRVEPDGGSSDLIATDPLTNPSGQAFFTVTSQAEETVHYTVFAAGLELADQIMIEFLYSDGEITLGNNFPNPFQTETMIPVAIPEPMRVRIDLFNSGGAHIQTIVDQDFNTGYYEVPFQPAGLSSGVYFYRLMTSEENKTKNMLLVR